MMSDATIMMDCDSYPTGGMGRAETAEHDTTSMRCENKNENGEWEDNIHQSATSCNCTTTTLTAPSLASGYGPAEMENALRIMTHAGRILWRAAMEAIPRGGVGSYNPSLGVLSKLFQRSFGKNGSSSSSSSNNSNSNIEKQISAFSFGRTQTTTGDGSHISTTAADIYETDNNVMETIPDDSTTRDSCEPIETGLGDTNGKNLSQPRKRKTLFGLISSLLPSVVSDSEEEEEEDNDRPSKRIRSSFENKVFGHCS
jgi:hypothetical protein